MSSSAKDGHLRSSHWGIVLNPTSSPSPQQRTSSQLRSYDPHQTTSTTSAITSQSSRRGKSSEKKFTRPASTTSKPFKCPTCPKSFERVGHLRTHINAVHLLKQPYRCDVPGCGHVFGHRSSLSRHKKGIHKME